MSETEAGLVHSELSGQRSSSGEGERTARRIGEAGPGTGSRSGQWGTVARIGQSDHPHEETPAAAERLSEKGNARIHEKVRNER